MGDGEYFLYCDVYTLPCNWNSIPDLRQNTKAKLIIIQNLSFVATLLHPLFTSGISRVIEIKDSQETGREEVAYSISLSKYLHVPPAKGVAFQGQPAPQVR
jgi:hypothetical protein